MSGQSLSAAERLPGLEKGNDYFTWIINAFLVTGISSIVVIITNCIIYKENIKNLIILVKKTIYRKEIN